MQLIQHWEGTPRCSCRHSLVKGVSEVPDEVFQRLPLYMNQKTGFSKKTYTKYDPTRFNEHVDVPISSSYLKERTNVDTMIDLCMRSQSSSRTTEQDCISISPFVIPKSSQDKALNYRSNGS